MTAGSAASRAPGAASPRPTAAPATAGPSGTSRRLDAIALGLRTTVDRPAHGGRAMPNAEEIREGQRATWARCSAGWEKWDDVIADQLGPVGAAIIERLGIANDQQHLDIASGTGEPGLSI